MSDEKEKPAEAKKPAAAPPSKSGAEPTKTHKMSEWAHDRPLIGCRVDPLSRYVVTGAQGNSLQRWDIKSGKKTELAGHDSWVRAIGFTRDGETLLSGGYDGRLIWWPLAAEKPTPTRTIDAHEGWVRAVVTSPDGTLVATCGNDNLIKLWNPADGKLIRSIAGHQRHVYNVAFHPSGEFLASADLMGVVKQWEVATGKEVRTFDGSALHKYDPTFRADIGGARSMASSPDGKYFACGGITNVTNAFAGVGNAIVVLFGWEKSEPVQKFTLKGNFRGVAWGLAFHPDGYVISSFAGSAGGQLAFFRPDKPNEFFKFKLATQGRDLDLAADKITLAVAHYDSKLRLYRMAEKQPAAEPAGEKKTG